MDDFPINEHTGILSLWANPLDSLRLNFNMDLMSADNFITRIALRTSSSIAVECHTGQERG